MMEANQPCASSHLPLHCSSHPFQTQPQIQTLVAESAIGQVFLSLSVGTHSFNLRYPSYRFNLGGNELIDPLWQKVSYKLSFNTKPCMTKPTPGILGRNLVQAASNSLDQRRNRLAAAPAHECLEFRKSVTA